METDWAYRLGRSMAFAVVLMTILISLIVVTSVQTQNGIMAQSLFATQSATAPPVTSVTSSRTSNNAVAVMGVLRVEHFNPKCGNLVPPCAMPSFVLPMIETRTAVYLLVSDDRNMQRQLLSSANSTASVAGFATGLNVSETYPAYMCSPYDCGVLTVQIHVTSVQSGLESVESS